MICTLALASLLLSKTATMQDVLPAPSPATVSKTLDTTGAGGAAVHVESTAQVTFSFLPGVPDDVVCCRVTCYHTCKGGHHKHSECDASCDSPCPYEHSAKVWADVVVPYSYELSTPDAELQAVCPVPALEPNKETATDLALEKAIYDATFIYSAISKTMKFDHFANPCSTAVKTVGYKEYVLQAHADVVSKITVSGMTSEATSSRTFTAARIYLPDESVSRTRQILNCVCEEPNTYSAGKFKDDDQTAPIWRPTQVTWGPAVDLGGSDVGLVGEGMNYANPFGKVSNGTRSGFYFPPGTELFSDDPAYQNVVVLFAKLLYYEPLSTTNRIPFEFDDDNKLTVACTQMHKKMPDKRRFKIGTVQDPKLRAIAELATEGFIRGMYDQLRIWIYTDKATREEMNEILFPKVTSSGYLRALYDDFRVNAIDLDDPGWKKCLNPNLVDGIGAPAKAKTWFVTQLSYRNPAGLAAAMAEAGPRLKDSIKLDGDVTGAAEMIDALGSSPAPEVHAALGDFVNSILAGPRGGDIKAKSKWLNRTRKAS